MMTVGGFLAKRSRRVSPPRIATSSSLTILMTCWAGFSAWETSAPSARSLTRGDELADHGQRDVGLEQRDPDLADGRVDVRLGQPALAAQVLEGRGEPVGEGGEHGGQGIRAVGRSPTARYERLQPRACRQRASARPRRSDRFSTACESAGQRACAPSAPTT